jgi:hypothetical protein
MCTVDKISRAQRAPAPTLWPLALWEEERGQMCSDAVCPLGGVAAGPAKAA